MAFKYPWLLLLLALLPVAWYLRARFGRKGVSLSFSWWAGVRTATKEKKPWRWRWPQMLELIAFAVIILAVARPQKVLSESDISSYGLDIMLALDVSGSMCALDFQPNNRLHVAKQVVADFVKGRESDRLGLVVFAGRSYTQCPLTLDGDMLVNALAGVELGMIEDGTAVGLGIASAAQRLRGGTSKDKIMVLITDGRNNVPKVEPKTAAQAAAALGIKIYTIGIGTRGKPVPVPVRGFFRETVEHVRIDLDEDALRQVAEISGGRYFAATDAVALKQIFAEIDSLEKVELEGKKYYQYEEAGPVLLLLALGLLSLAVLLKHSWCRVLP